MANQLGAGQAIDLLKGMVMPAIMSAVKPAGRPAAAAALLPRRAAAPSVAPAPSRRRRACHNGTAEATSGSAVPLQALDVGRPFSRLSTVSKH